MEENLKKCWCDANFHKNNVTGNRRKTALQALALRYKRFSCMGIFFAFMTPFTLFKLFYSHHGLCSLWMSIAVIAVAVIYFLTASCMDRWLYRGISTIDVAEMSVSEVCRLAYYYRKKHFQFMAILLPMATIFIGGLVWIFSGYI